MERKNLQKILSYLPVIVATCDCYGWCGGRGAPVPQSAVSETKLFFDYLQSFIPLKDIPDLEGVEGDIDGGVLLLWESEVDPVEVTYDSFAVTVFGDQTIAYTGRLETLGVEIHDRIPLEPELTTEILQYIRFFSRPTDG